MKKIKVAIVGFGFMGKTHALNVLQSDHMELVAIVDKGMTSIEGALQQVAGNFSTGSIPPETLSVVRNYQSVDDCLENEQLDAMLVCVHTPSHYEIAKKALERDLHVFVEKPFVLDIAQGESLIALAQVRGRVLLVGHVVRFMPAYRKLRELVQGGKYGALQFISLTRFTGVPNWGEWGKRQTEFGSSGGALFDLIIHDIDYLQHLLGMPDQLTCTYSAGTLSRHDYLCAFWTYKDKPLQVKVEGGDTFHSSFSFEASFKAQFEQATLSWNSDNGLEIKVADNQKVETIPVGDANDGFKQEIEYFGHCILTNQTPEESSAASALDTIKLCYRHVE